MKSPISLAVGQKYPLRLASAEGAAAHFLGRTGSILQIGMPDLIPSETKLLRQGSMRAGLYVDGPLIVLLFDFRAAGQQPIELDCPFDARVIPRDELFLPDITTGDQRLLVEVHIVDSATNTVRGLRGITLPPAFTVAFLSAVQDQLAAAESLQGRYQEYLRVPLDARIKSARMEPCGV
ncbi:hypothetical protein [Azotobacter vinelandii]|uniref:hypothetical protein n=1 Tax=Azotobacter vinelandii TaxID=354 RepID=UPI00091729D1|nr:hypothetical protein [Azotobacter vinelandii]SFY33687.1 hypothetical protein SAMN04244547_05169 [Azotobacter vinelandii]